tara:strand:- start:75386 stop:77509 length:2124 start_codon:yes stop_codon:yes gene_type:complete
MDDMQEIMDDFFAEADESLDELEQDLIKLETACDVGDFDSDLVDRIFRVLHTLKGGAGFLGLEYMAKLSHAGENLLDEVRGGKVEVSTRVMDALLKTNDLLKELLDLEKSGGDASTVFTADVIIELEKLAHGDTAPAAKEVEPQKVEENEAVEVSATQNSGIVVNEELLAEIAADDRLEGGSDDDEDEVAEVSAVAEDSGIVVNEELLAEIAADDRLEGGSNDDEEKAKPIQAEAVERVAVVKRGEAAADERREKEDRRKEPRRVVEKAETTIRVETGKLDQTMNLVGELVLARNSLIRYLNLPEMKVVIDSAPYINEVMANIEHLSQVTKDLQLSVLSTRMQPIKKVFDKIPRQVRDLKSKLGREVDLVIEGEFTEVDKSLVEELSDPMVHLIRNSLDHGIEKPADREAVGKSPTGTLKVSAFYEGNKVVIQVKDDGAGIDPEKIKKLALKKGVITEKDMEILSDEDAVRLIMAPGFSTAEVVSDVSGRGVGMDVVNSSIEEIKGTIDIVSEFGVGTTINIYLPLTLAIVQALVVKSQEEGFAIPIGDINEVIKFNPDEVHKMSNQEVIELRGAVLPLFHLKELTTGIKMPKLRAEVHEIDGHLQTDIVVEGPLPKEKPAKKAKVEAKVQQDGKDNFEGYVVVVSEGKQTLGLVVEELVGQEEAVIKALGNTFDYHNAISGATITGDGTVRMILDVPYLIKEITKK